MKEYISMWIQLMKEPFTKKPYSTGVFPRKSQYNEFDYQVFITFIGILSIILLGIGGYVMNIVEIVNYEGGVNPLIILRFIGTAIFPLGSILGYF